MTITSELFGDLFSTAEMRAIFADKQSAAYYLEIERTLASVQAQLGIIPQEAAAAIMARAHLEYVDWETWQAGVAAAGVPTIPMVKAIIAAVGPAGEWCHYGATTQDIMDTAIVLQMRDALAIVDRQLATINGSLRHLAQEHRETPMAGRSQLQQALPITFGLKAAGWLSIIRRQQSRLEAMRPRLLVGQFGGAVGTLASLGDKGIEVQRRLCQELGLAAPGVSWHTARDSLAEVVSYLGLLTGSLAKIGLDIALLAQNEVAEVAEAPAPGRGGSSTMPNKRNPISAQRILVASRLVRAQVPVMLEALVNDHERGTGIWPVEWVAIPDSFLLSSVALAEAVRLLAGLQVFPAQMARNLALSRGLMTAEAVMMALAPKLGRATAHDLVKEAVQVAIEQDLHLAAALRRFDQVTELLTPADLERLTDPAHYIGQATVLVDAVLAEQGA